MPLQLFPAVSQRSHWYVYVNGVAPDQVPVDTVSVCPSVGVPLIFGSTTSTGLVPPTTALASAWDVACPAEFVAVTVARSVCPTSALPTVYDWLVAPEMSEQLLPFVSQRRHWYVYVIGVEPDQLPFDTVSCEPMDADPVIFGSAELVGAVLATVTTLVAADNWLAEPAPFVAVTLERNV
jgi:hypothetical protein